MILSEFVNILEELFSPKEFKDISLNGLQVGNVQANVKKVACAVDSGLEIFQKAVQENADCLFVHHGLFWGKPLALTEGHYERIKYLMDNNLALYAMHLPLDAHPEVGNNKGIAEELGLKNLSSFGCYNGKNIGFKGVCPKKKSLHDICRILKLRESDCYLWDFGSSEISSIAIISGDAPHEVCQAIAEGVDLYITGESSHALYHLCKEAKMNVLFAGHYLTECYGPRLFGNWINKKYSLETVFIDCPTGL